MRQTNVSSTCSFTETRACWCSCAAAKASAASTRLTARNCLLPPWMTPPAPLREVRDRITVHGTPRLLTHTVAGCLHHGAVVLLSDRQDAVTCAVALPGCQAMAPLSLGVRRGLACAFVDITRGVMMDLEAADEDR